MCSFEVTDDLFYLLFRRNVRRQTVRKKSRFQAGEQNVYEFDNMVPVRENWNEPSTSMQKREEEGIYEQIPADKSLDNKYTKKGAKPKTKSKEHLYEKASVYVGNKDDVTDRHNYDILKDGRINMKNSTRSEHDYVDLVSTLQYEAQNGGYADVNNGNYFILEKQTSQADGRHKGANDTLEKGCTAGSDVYNVYESYNEKIKRNCSSDDNLPRAKYEEEFPLKTSISDKSEFEEPIYNDSEAINPVELTKNDVKEESECKYIETIDENSEENISCGHAKIEVSSTLKQQLPDGREKEIRRYLEETQYHNITIGQNISE